MINFWKFKLFFLLKFKVLVVKKELETHLESLPDLSSLDAAAQLTPLPSAGELFK